MSSQPPTLATIEKTKKKKPKKTKDTVKSAALISLDEDISDDDPSYKPPEGTVLLPHDVDVGEFDWDTVEKDDDLELWLMRVPEEIKPKHLTDIKMSVPSSSERNIVGTFSRKHTNYDVWSIHANDGGQSNQASAVGGEEVLGLSCLLPRRKKGGKLYYAPKPIARHLVLSAQTSLPTPDPSSPESISQSSRRYRHPPHLLKHRFVPSGGIKVDYASLPDVTMDIDASAVAATAPTSPVEVKDAKVTVQETPKEEKVKVHKRKTDAPLTKKSKKVKTS